MSHEAFFEDGAAVGELASPAPAAERAGPAEACSSFGSSPVDRAFGEYCQLLDAGEAPDHAEFCARYPGIESSLAKAISVAGGFWKDSEFRTKPLVAWPSAGQLFLGFQLEREVGRGAFSHVFLATEPALGHRCVVIKVSRLGAGEALTLGRLEHVNIAPVHSVVAGGSCGLAAICMPYLGEATLNTLLKRLRKDGVPRRAQVILDVARANRAAETQPRTAGAVHSEAVLRHGDYAAGVRHLARQLLDALAFIHARGVVHRDLKPSNVLLAHGAVPMLLDFNLSGDVCRTDARFGGTPVYMSPEQLALMGTADADEARVGACSDLFSLGVILYELLTGVHPFVTPGQGTSLPQMRRDLLWNQQAGARPVRELIPSVDRALAELIGRCLAFLPEDRPSAAAALALLPPIAAPRLAKPTRTGALILLAASLVGGYLWVGEPPHREVAVPMVQPDRHTPVVVASISDLQRGQEAFARKDYDAAVGHLGRHLANNSKDAGAWFTRGLVFLKLAEQGRQSFGLAVSDFSEADQLRPNVQTKACLAYALQRKDDGKNASVYYAQAIAGGCKSAAVFNNLGYIHLRLSDWSDAEHCFDRALELQPELQAAYHNRGRLYLMRAKPGPKLFATTVPRKSGVPSEEHLLQQALRDLSRAIDLGPASRDLYFEVALVCTRLAVCDPGLRDRAIGYLDLAIQHGLDPRQLDRNGFTRVLAGHWWFDDLRRRPRVAGAATEARSVVAIPAE
jgi:serine/threonine protein kinase/Tfp pilus assembly protein PilF